MKSILMQYYRMPIEVNRLGYFLYQDDYFYLLKLDDHVNFMENYHFYRHIMNQSHIQGYTIVKNQFSDIVSDSYVLLKYQKSVFSIEDYITMFLTPIQSTISLNMIKEQWIEKIDETKEYIKKYAYSFKQNVDMMSLIYYYCGVGENCINLLNEIILTYPKASCSMGLSIKTSQLKYNYELLNPVHYIFSSRMRMIAHLLRSGHLNVHGLDVLLRQNYFQLHEILYLYARLLFPSDFFDMVICGDINEENIKMFLINIEQEIKLFMEVAEVLSFYVSLPKISWIYQQNMI